MLALLSMLDTETEAFLIGNLRTGLDSPMFAAS